jgi:oxygen-independent coproporphyrinogen-3 oxidase
MSDNSILLEQGREQVRSLPLAALEREGIFIDRLNDNPEAPRHFIAFGDWHALEVKEIFANLDPVTMKRTMVYLDFPYCKRVCNFCAFYPVVARGGDEMVRYFGGMEREIDLLADVYFSQNAAIEGVELGGGTPTVTPLPLLKSVVDRVFERFPVDAGDEHSFEATPDSIVDAEGFEKLRYLRERGFSRISMGIQSFNDAVLQSMNRSHASNHIEPAVENIRKLGYGRINFDILVGTPNQPVVDFLESITRSIDLGIEVLELYAMRYFDTRKHVPAARKVLKGAEYSNAEDILAARIAADTMLRKAGYTSCNGRTYQRDGQSYFSNYFLENFKGSNLLGIGRKSHSNLYPFQYANYLNIEKYLSHLEDAKLPIGAGCRFDARARLGKLLTGALQLPGDIDLPALKGLVAASHVSDFDDVFVKFASLGLLERKPEDVYGQTFFGFLFVEEMMKVVFEKCVKPFTANAAFLGKEQVGRLPAAAVAP